MMHDQLVFNSGRLRGLVSRLEAGGTWDAEGVAFVKKFADDLLVHEQEWIDALKQQEEASSLAAIHAASWGPPE